MSTADNYLYDPDAEFFVIGDGLRNMPVLISHSGTGTLPDSTSLRNIEANDDNTLTLGEVGTDPSSGEGYYIGAYQGVIQTGRFTGDSTLLKRFNRINITYAPQQHGIEFEITYQLDFSNAVSSRFFTQDTGRASIIIPSGQAVGIQIIIRTVGNNHPFRPLAIELEVDTLGGTKLTGAARASND